MGALKYHDGTQFNPVFDIPKRGTKSFVTSNVQKEGGIEVIDESFNNRSLIRKLKVTPSDGGVISYVVEFFTRDTFLAADLEYKATGNGTLIDNDLWMHEDEDSTSELHLKITNNSLVISTFTIDLIQEELV